MARSFLTALTTFALSFSLFSYFSTDPGLSRKLSASKQSLINTIMSHHKAPLQSTEKPEWEGPDRCTVFLASGVSYAQHKQAIGDQIDLERFVESVRPYFPDDTVMYDATFDDAQLRIIRKHESVKFAGPIFVDHYEATLVGENSDQRWLAPNRYTVFLMPGVSFARHKQAIGDEVDLDRFEESAEPFGENVITYDATFDDAQLSIIRKSRSVKLVECVRIMIAGHHEAPLHGRDDHPESLVPNSYMIILAPGVSFAQHKKAIGSQLDLDQFEKSSWANTERTVVYSAELDDTQLSLIRADPSVEYVECNRIVRGC